MEEKGIIVENRPESLLVRIERHSACGDCDRQCGLALEAEKEDTVVEVNKNGNQDFTYREGQQIILEMKESNLIFSALLIYVFPLLTMIAGFFLLENIFGTEFMGIVGSLAGFGLGFLIVRFINQQVKGSRKFEPKIKDVIGDKGIKNEGSGE